METHYERLGGEETIRRLVDRFYDLMDEDPDYYGIRKLHAQDLAEARSKLFMFLSGWTGGPQLYRKNSAIRACASATCRSPSARRSATSGWGA